MIRLIASDLDGTIINAKNQCDPSVTEEIRRLREHGMKFAVCSGRPIDSVLPLLEGWGLSDLSDYVVGSNGGEVLETATGKRQEYYPLEPDLIREIIDLYEPLNLIPTLYDGTRLYVSRITPAVKVVAARVGVDPAEGDIRALTTTPQLKEMFILDGGSMEEVEQFAKDHADPRFVGFKTAPDLFELCSPLLAKDIGVKVVAAMMRINPSEIMAFGDTTNDIEMLRWVRYGVAMENGTDDAKAAAWKTAGPVDEQGFAKFLKAHVSDTLEVI
ncbi:MAG: Cof-type HAD-IIB family hydrolase [Solobacterium sp.]|nr:Cof-type HAD-IIB family hydrolase [Solobacterium sp.]